MTISPESVWKTLSLWYQIPNPKLPILDTVGRNTQRAQMDSDVTHERHDPRANTSTQSRDLHYTDKYVTEEQQHDTSFDHDCGFTYSLEARVHSMAASIPLPTLSLSTTGSAFTHVKFQTDTAATCNILSLSTLRSLLPDAELKRSPYRLYRLWNL